MPRALRIAIPGQPLHLIQRGNNRSRCFVDDQDRERYKRILGESSERTACAIHAYVLMTNHVHLLITAQDALSPSRMMQALGRRYVRYFNERHDRTGTLWEGRFRSTLVDAERYFFACSRYIENNPVRAGLVTQPQHYAWSSHRRNAHGEADALVTSHDLYVALAKRRARRLDRYRALFTSAADVELDEAIRRATNSGSMLGDTRSRAAVGQSLGRPVTRVAHGGDRRSASFRRGDGAADWTNSPGPVASPSRGVRSARQRVADQRL